MTSDTEQDPVATGAADLKRTTPEAGVVLGSHMSRLEQEIRQIAQAKAQSEVVDSTLMRDAIASAMHTPPPRAVVGDWLKWFGFFFGGVALPLLIGVLSKETPERIDVVWAIISLMVATILITSALVVDIVGARRT